MPCGRPALQNVGVGFCSNVLVSVILYQINCWRGWIPSFCVASPLRVLVLRQVVSFCPWFSVLDVSCAHRAGSCDAFVLMFPLSDCCRFPLPRPSFSLLGSFLFRCSRDLRSVLLLRVLDHLILSMSCRPRFPWVATDSASVVSFPLTDDAALMVGSALGKVAHPYFLLPGCRLSKTSAWMLLCTSMLLVW